MDSTSDSEELPYVVWYQCRMCTHLLFDDIEKMFLHFDKKHGAMIDCDELRNIVYKNGLCMGGLSRSPKPGIKLDDGNETATELISPSYTHSAVDDDEDFDKPLLKQEMIEANGMVLSNTHDEDAYYDDNYQDDGINGEYEESSYEPSDVNGGRYIVHDDEEQLKEEDFDFSANEGQLTTGKYDEASNQIMENSNHCKSSQDFSEHEEMDNHAEVNFQEEGDEGELSVSAEQSVNEDDYDELMYGNEGDYDDLDEEQLGEEGMYSNNGNQNGGILNYGFSCKFCGKFFTTRRGVESHEQHHKNQSSPIIKRTNEGRLFPCKICKDKSFSSFKDLKSHVKTHTPERIHICKFCFSTFNNTASLTKHLTIHTRENPHKCHCGKTFVSANTLKIHKKIHTGIKPFVCNFFQCGRAFVTKSTLESHLRTHTGEKPYQCSYCPSSFTTSSAKYRHERHVHKVPEPSIM